MVAVEEVLPHHNVYHGMRSDKYTDIDHAVRQYMYLHSNKVIFHTPVVVRVEGAAVLQLIKEEHLHIHYLDNLREIKQHKKRNVCELRKWRFVQ